MKMFNRKKRLERKYAKLAEKQNRLSAFLISVSADEWPTEVAHARIERAHTLKRMTRIANDLQKEH